MIHAHDIQAEHEAALRALAPEQKRDLARLAMANQKTNFNGRTPKENLSAMFEKEARFRTSRGRSTGSPNDGHPMGATNEVGTP
jgi:hypothetical protein